MDPGVVSMLLCAVFLVSTHVISGEISCKVVPKVVVINTTAKVTCEFGQDVSTGHSFNVVLYSGTKDAADTGEHG
jgi:hypothetical protein